MGKAQVHAIIGNLITEGMRQSKLRVSYGAVGKLSQSCTVGVNSTGHAAADDHALINTYLSVVELTM